MAVAGGSGILCNPTSAYHPLPFTSTTSFHFSSTRTAAPIHPTRRLGLSCGSRTSLFPRVLLRRKSLWRGCSGKRDGGLTVSCGKVSFVDQSKFREEVLDSGVPVLVDFVADWCGPCRLIAPIVDWVSEEYKDRLKVVKIDHDASPQLIEKYKVYGLPTLIVFKDGEEVPSSRREGAITKIKLKQFLDSFLEERAVS